MQKTGRGESTPFLNFEEAVPQIYKKHIAHVPHLAISISDSEESLTDGMGMSSKADRGLREGWAPTRRRKTLHRNKTGVPRPAETRLGPLVGPSRTRFHWATRSTMTWRHARWGRGILRRSGRPFSCTWPCLCRAGWPPSWLQC